MNREMIAIRTAKSSPKNCEITTKEPRNYFLKAADLFSVKTTIFKAPGTTVSEIRAAKTGTVEVEVAAAAFTF
jgi:hypothetical protein